MGPTLTNSNFNPETYASYFSLPNSHLSSSTEEIERLRPKSPVKLKSDRGGGAPRGGPNAGRGGDGGRERNRGGFRGRGGPHRGFPPR